MATATTGIGTKLEYSTDGSTYTQLLNINSISGPSFSRDEIDITTLENQSGYREYILGLRDAGSLSLTLNYEKAGYQTLLDMYDADQLYEWRITLPDASTFEFSGYVMELPLTIPVDDKISFDCTIRVTGAPTFTPGT